MPVFDPTKDCLFFAGGRKLNANPDNNNSTLKLQKSNKTLELNLRMVFNALEIESAVKNFDELGVAEGEIRDKLSNIVFLEAYDNQQAPKSITIKDPSFSILYDKDDKATIVITGSVQDSGKTDHVKTDHGQLG